MLSLAVNKDRCVHLILCRWLMSDKVKVQNTPRVSQDL